MADSFKYTPPNAAAWRELATNPHLRAALLQEGFRAMAHAKELIMPHNKTGEMENDFHLVEATMFINGHPRAAVQLQNTNPRFAALEWGNRGNRKGPDAKSQPALILTRTLQWLAQK
jgi:hypothetical protein